MKPKTIQLISVCVLVAIVMFAQELFAQGCVQCRMAPASDLKNGGTAAGNVNHAILYLMAVPYLLLVSIAVYVFRKQLKEKWTQLRGGITS